MRNIIFPNNGIKHKPNRAGAPIAFLEIPSLKALFSINTCERLVQSKKSITFAVRFLKLLCVKAFKEYRIPYIGLKLGKHQFEFTLTAEFFDKFEFSEIHGCRILALVELEKQSTMLILSFKLNGEVTSVCDHCGDDISIDIHADHQMVVKFGETTGDADDEILVLGPSEHEIDISQYLYEFAHLALPARHVHKDLKDCNPEVVKQLEKYKVDETASTQWAALKNLNYEGPEDNEFFEEEE